MSVADLELRSVVCLPLVQIRSGSSAGNAHGHLAEDTVGLLYMDSRLAPADLSSGNREMLQTLAIEASTILENARLLEEERDKQRMEEELKIARDIQQGSAAGRCRQKAGSAPPDRAFLRASGRRLFRRAAAGARHVWAAVVADVSGKGVSSALLASLLQGAFFFASEGPARDRRHDVACQPVPE